MVFGSQTIKTLPGWKPETQLSIKWKRLSSNNWSATDRGSSADVYRTKITVYGNETYINSIILGLDSYRRIYIPFTTFYDDEKIFGENIDYTGTLNCILLEKSPRRQLSFKGFSFDLSLELLSPTFTGSSSFPTLQYTWMPEQAREYLWKYYPTYDRTWYYTDGYHADSGTFNGTFILTAADMVLLRNYIKTQRTGNFTLSDTFGVDYPFGRESLNSYPYTCKLIEWEDLGLWGQLYRRIRLKFAEVLS